jgi:hypothetical protein
VPNQRNVDRLSTWLFRYRVAINFVTWLAFFGLLLASVRTQFWDEPLARPKLLQSIAVFIGLLWFRFSGPLGGKGDG